MSFQQPLYLLALLAVPLAIGLYLLTERRRMRYAVRFTNLDVLASVAGRLDLAPLRASRRLPARARRRSAWGSRGRSAARSCPRSAPR